MLGRTISRKKIVKDVSALLERALIVRTYL